MRKPDRARAMTQRPKFFPWYFSWSILALGIGLISVNSVKLVVVETARQDIRTVMLRYQKGLGNDADILLSRANSLPSDYPFPEALAEIRADARAIVRYTVDVTQQENMEFPDTEHIVKDYQYALEAKPENSNLWAKYALFLVREKTTQSRDVIIYALSRAIALGPQDYNTIKISIEVGIRSWPWLPCSLQLELVDLIDRAEKIDDLALGKWSGEQKLPLMSGYIKRLSEIYRFNLQWAKRSVRRCES